MNPFDASVIHFFNHYTQQSLAVEKLVWDLDNPLLKGAVIMSILWALWFRESQTRETDRQFILSAMIMGTAALFAARVIGMLLPFRERPLRNPTLSFYLPHGIDPQSLLNWNSFPSDHAVLFFCLSTCIWFISRKLGLLAFLHAFFIVCLPRVLTGLHYPTDIIGGAALGTSMALCLKIEPLRDALARFPMRWLERSPASFYPCFYLATFLLGLNFDPLRAIYVPVFHAMLGSF